jgi:hypothetical protein
MFDTEGAIHEICTVSEAIMVDIYCSAFFGSVQTTNYVNQWANKSVHIG